jgi:hypothetical protein
MVSRIGRSEPGPTSDRIAYILLYSRSDVGPERSIISESAVSCGRSYGGRESWLLVFGSPRVHVAALVLHIAQSRSPGASAICPHFYAGPLRCFRAPLGQVPCAWQLTTPRRNAGRSMYIVSWARGPGLDPGNSHPVRQRVRNVRGRRHYGGGCDGR